MPRSNLHTTAFTKCACLLTTLLGLAAGSVRAATVVNVSSQATPNLAGFQTYTLTATTDEGVFVGFDFVGDGSSGFFGPMNQINPFTLATVFNDNNAAFPAAGADVLQDSQFLVDSTTGIAVNASEDGDSLQAAFNLTSGDFASSFAFAQIVIPNGQTVGYSGTLTIDTGSENSLAPASGSIGVPEPEAGILCLIGLVLCLAGVARLRSSRSANVTSMPDDWWR